MTYIIFLKTIISILRTISFIIQILEAKKIIMMVLERIIVYLL